MAVADSAAPILMAGEGERELDGTGSFRRRYEDREPAPPPAPQSGLSISVSTIQFLIQLAVLLVTVCAFGFSIKGAVEILSVKVQAQQEKIDSLEKKIELMRYDQGQMQTDIGIMKAGRWRPTKEPEP